MERREQREGLGFEVYGPSDVDSIQNGRDEEKGYRNPLIIIEIVH